MAENPQNKAFLWGGWVAFWGVGPLIFLMTQRFEEEELNNAPEKKRLIEQFVIHAEMSCS